MKKIILISSCVLAIHLHSQVTELSGGIGVATYYGDLNIVNSGAQPLAVISDGLDPKSYKMSFSVGIRRNFKNYFSLGIQWSHLSLSGDDADNRSRSSQDAAYYRIVRNLNFYSKVNEVALNLRYEPFRTFVRWDNPRWFLSPYVGASLGVFSFNPKTNYQGNEIELQPLGTEGQGTVGKESKYSLMQLSMPLSIGFKLNAPNRKFAIGFDMSYHLTFTDYLDDVSTVYPSTFAGDAAAQALAAALSNRNLSNESTVSSITSPGNQRGNPNNNDHFLTAQLRFSYYLGKANTRQTFCSSF